MWVLVAVVTEAVVWVCPRPPPPNASPRSVWPLPASQWRETDVQTFHPDGVIGGGSVAPHQSVFGGSWESHEEGWGL